MANKRMFTMKICDSDAFLDMPLSAQCLYFHLNMRADDDGFIDNPKRITKLIGAKEDDLRILIGKRFVLVFDNGVIVIKHWRMHNTLSKGRYHPTQYLDEKGTLLLKENGSYSLNSGAPIDDTRTIEMFAENKRRTSGEQVENTDIGLGLDKDLDIDIDKDINIKRKGVSKDTPKRKERNIPPSADEEEEHSNTRHNFHEVTKAWNELKPFGVNSVTKVVPTTERGKCLKARIADYGLDDVLKAIDLVKQSKFLQGNNDRDWKITFDWFVKPNNFIKVLEGNYTDTKPDNPNNFENRTVATAKERQMAEWEATFGSFDD